MKGLITLYYLWTINEYVVNLSVENCMWMAIEQNAYDALLYFTVTNTQASKQYIDCKYNF